MGQAVCLLEALCSYLQTRVLTTHAAEADDTCVGPKPKQTDQYSYSSRFFS